MLQEELDDRPVPVKDRVMQHGHVPVELLRPPELDQRPAQA
jgi:hypothetical protein